MLNLIGGFVGRAHAQAANLGLRFLDINTSFTGLTDQLLTWFLIAAGVIAVVYLVYGGILYITAGGDAEKATKGRTAVINAIIGIIIILLAYVIVRWVGSILQGRQA